MGRYKIAIVEVEQIIGDTYKVWFKVLRKGPKRRRYVYVRATDELDAYLKAEQLLKELKQ